MVRDGGIEPVILLSKSDLVGADILGQRLPTSGAFKPAAGCCLQRRNRPRARGYPLSASARQDLLPAGSSGVGKTTLLNRLLERTHLKQKQCGAMDGKGRHTTSRRQLVSLASALLS